MQANVFLASVLALGNYYYFKSLTMADLSCM